MLLNSWEVPTLADLDDIILVTFLSFCLLSPKGYAGVRQTEALVLNKYGVVFVKNKTNA